MNTAQELSEDQVPVPDAPPCEDRDEAPAAVTTGEPEGPVATGPSPDEDGKARERRRPGDEPPGGRPTQRGGLDRGGTYPIEGPVRVAWREGTLTRATELEALTAWVRSKNPCEHNEILEAAIGHHIQAAREAATAQPLDPPRRLRIFRNGPLMERALSNLDAAEAHILNIAPAEYVLGQMPCLLRRVQCHLGAADPGRQEFERLARSIGVSGPDRAASQTPTKHELDDELRDRKRKIDDERGTIVTTVRAASSAALREHVKLRNFRNIVGATAAFMLLLAVGIALTGFYRPTLIPLCFAPEESGTVTVVCPTGQSDRFVPAQDGGESRDSLPVKDIDEVVAATVSPQDLVIVELVGLTAAAIATAAAIRSIRGSSARYSLPVALAALKLPTGAITAFLGLLLMRGQFVPGLSALDTSAQILAWALVFGYAQQLFTRLVDQQGQTVLNSVGPPDVNRSGTGTA
jgi:hypothetical protein